MTDLTDRDFERTKRRIKRLVAKWRGRLGLNQWQFNHYWYRGEIPKDIGGDRHDMLHACVNSDWKYLEASLNWSCGNLSGHDDAELEETSS